MTGVPVGSQAVAIHWAASVAMGMTASYPSETIWVPIWLRVVASFWPLNTLYSTAVPAAALASSSASMAVRISSRLAWSICWTMATR